MAKISAVIRGPDWATPLGECLDQAPADLALWMEQHTQLLKCDRYSTVGLLEIRAQSCFLKLYFAKSPLQQFGYRLGIGRGIRSFDAADAMLSAGLRVSAPLACLLVPGGLALLTETIAQARDLKALRRSSAWATEAASFMASAAEALAALHRAGFAHGDCKWSNLLWNGNTFYAVDLEGVREVGFDRGAVLPPRPRQLRDLARFTIDAEELGATQAQYDIFITAYAAATNSPRHLLARGIQSAAEPIRRRHFRKYGKAPPVLL